MILLPQAPKIISKKDSWASFEIEGLYPGYGITIGNSLRRVLLSSLEGAAVTRVKIKGVQHEFSTIPDVLEDMIVIMMNLKQMRFKVFSNEPQKATLKVKGEKKVTGADFKFSSQVELVNKDCHIATLTSKKASLEMEIQIEKGIGYEPIERRKIQEKLEIGQLPVDAIFTPMKRVNYKVENMRVGERTDFDRLKLEIETDGTISPEDSFFKATEILVQHFALLNDAFKPKEEIKTEKAAEKKERTEAKEEEDAAKTKVEQMKLSTRTINALLSNNVKTAGGLARKDEKALLELEGMGDKAVEEVRKALKKLGLELKKSE